MATNKPRIKVTLEPELLAMIEDFQIRNGYPDRSMAMHALLNIGLEAMENEIDDPTPKIHRREKRKKDGDDK